MFNLEEIDTKVFSTVFIKIGLAEQHIKMIGKPNVAKYDFFIFKLSSFMDGAWQLEGASLHLEMVPCT